MSKLLNKKRVITNKSKLEYRMYGLVPYNISPIQQGIQYGHALQEYNNKHFDDEDFRKWRLSDKTFIIYNGGTTNHSGYLNSMGSMNKHLIELESNKIKVATFYEPDLGNQLTAIVFLVDERVWNKEKYPDDNGWDPFEDWTIDIENKELKKIMFLRMFLKQFRFA